MVREDQKCVCLQRVTELCADEEIGVGDLRHAKTRDITQDLVTVLAFKLTKLVNTHGLIVHSRLVLVIVDFLLDASHFISETRDGLHGFGQGRVADIVTASLGP